MAGHGSPRTSSVRRLPVARRAAAATALRRAVVLLLFLSSSPVVAADDLRVRIAWGGGAERTWRGVVSVSDGSLAEPCPMGVEADEPGSMWIDGGSSDGKTKSLVIQQRSPRGYDGVDVSVSAPTTARMILKFTPSDEPAHPSTVEIPLADLSGEFINRELDGQGNRLLVMRAPGDSLRVRFSRASLVFAPGEMFRCSLEPHALPLPKGGGARIKIQLLDSAGKEHWAHQCDTPADREEPIPLEVPLPDAEGVYDLAIAASNSPNWSQAVRQPLNWRRTIAERRVQLLVLDPRPATATTAKETYSQVVEIDPANPRWYEKFNKLPSLQLPKPRMPRLWKGPLGNDCLTSREHPLGALAQLKPNADSPDVSWEAYWLPIDRPGRPHILEIDYPSDVSQTLGVSLLEPNASGALAPLCIDSGVDNVVESFGPAVPPEWKRHRLVFWPRTATPLLLVTNGRDRMPAVYGKIRVLSAGRHLPPAAVDRDVPNRRLLAAYLDRPLIPENFAAGECLDPWSGRSLDDWTTFYEGGSRLVEYLHHAGNNGLMLGVLADGSAIYPSTLLEPTPRYDTGAFFASAQDPVRKDVLEMLLRLFDRENLQLIPMIEFAAPLPELEAIRRAGGPAAEGIEWIGADGATLGATLPSRRGLAPYYNVLDPRVQQAMLRVVRELIGRYAGHPSLAGAALRLSADGYAQLPGPDWGLDDATIARFERDAKINVPGEGPKRFAKRAAFLAGESPRRVWLEWRAAELAKFHRRIYDELVLVRPNSRLYLAGADMLGGPELEASLRPALLRRTTTASALLQVGIDPRHYRDETRGIVLLRPERILPERNLSSRAVDLEIGQMADFDRLFQGVSATGSLFFHPPREWHADSFDRKNPFKPGCTAMLSQPSPSDERNRRRFVHSLAALDSQVMIDGGWALSMGQEAALGELAAAYRALPAIRFQPAANIPSADAVGPVVFRYGTHGGRTYLYAVNDAPFAAMARVHVEAGPNCRIEELTGRRKIKPLEPEATSGLSWEVSLAPFDLVAVQLSEPDARCSSPHVAWPDAVETALALQIRGLGARAAALRNPPPLNAVANADFERAANAAGQIPDWATTQQDGVGIELDKTLKHDGRQSVKITSRGPVACLVSRPLAVPSTGRLAVSVWLRVDDAARQPPLRLAIEAKLHGSDYYKFAQVGAAPNAGQAANAIPINWEHYVLHVGDLPLEGLTALRVRFDLMGPGEVWVDDVQVYTLAFSAPEMHELAKLILLADVKLQNGQIGDCFHLLDGYWPRFLEENVALPAGAVLSNAAAVQPRDEEEKPPERSGLLNRVKDMVPESLRF